MPHALGGPASRGTSRVGRTAPVAGSGAASADTVGAPSKPRRGAAAIAERFARIGLVEPIDFVLHLPLRYEDETTIAALDDVGDGEVAQVEVVVRDHAVQFRPRRQLVVRTDDVHPAGRAGSLTLRFFHFYGSQVRHFEPGTVLRVRGPIRGSSQALFGRPVREAIHPGYAVVRPGDPLPDRLTPVYPAGVGLSQTALRRAIARALADIALDETLPAAIIGRTRLPAVDAALRTIHNPPADVSLESLAARTHPAWQRIKFDELLAQQLSLAKAHAARRARTAPILAHDGRLVARLFAELPFALTEAQRRVIGEIEADLLRPHPMQRLLQGDVGSGKTVVAATAALQAIEAGYQAVLMAPTELLAEQHFAKLSEWIAALGVPVAWLTGSLTKKARTAARDAIESGTARLVVGTHALIQDDVHFARLGLAIVDEQHRFGVGQRLALRFKGKGIDDAPGIGTAREPHQLMMSATPIPRTLAMTYFADLDVSTIDALPPGRKPIVTKLVDASRRAEVVARVRDAIDAGCQVYWVCPRVDAVDDAADDAIDASADDATPATTRRPSGRSTQRDRLELQAAVETHRELSVALPDVAVGLVHGRLAAADKADAMHRFARGQTRLLVATTVIEVGVDVPNASLMVIEHAERFGLAQLHQLRGRVGRGTAESACVLLYQSPLSANAKERLRTMRETQDGFAIAAKDLELRGPGEFLGHRQSGEALLRFADLERDQALVDAARAAAAEMLDDHRDAVDRHLERWLRGADELLKA